MRVVAFGITLVGVSVVGLGVVHKLLAYLLIDVVNGLASAICMGPMRTIIQTETDEMMAPCLSRNTRETLICCPSEGLKPSVTARTSPLKVVPPSLLRTLEIPLMGKVAVPCASVTLYSFGLSATKSTVAGAVP